MNQEFYKVAAAVPRVKVADCDYNTDSIIDICKKLNAQGVRLAVFPELSITGSTCGDLFRSEVLIDNCYQSLARIADESESWDMAVVVGAVVSHDNNLYNCGVLISHGEIVAAVPKNDCDRNGCFVSGGNVEAVVTIAKWNVLMVSNQVIPLVGANIAIIVGEYYSSPISELLQINRIEELVIAHLGARKEAMGEYDNHIKAIKQQSANRWATYIYSGAGYGESTTDNVYDGKAIIAQEGDLLAKNRRWQTDEQIVVAEAGKSRTKVEEEYVEDNETTEDNDVVYPNPYIPTEELVDSCCSDAVSIQIMALMRRLEVTRCKNLVIGISGGLDSTLALLVAVKTFDRMGLDRKGIIGVTMPGFGTTDRTYNNALVMMRSLGITMREISIVNAVTQHFSDIEHDVSVHDITYENSQARERTQILMDIANQVGGMVLGTGDMSELALGWATYNGDHMSMYGINAGVPKTLVRRLVKWIADAEEDETCRRALVDVIDTPISPELVPADEDGNIKQKTEDLVGPYELHDFFMYYILRYGYGPTRIYALAQQAFVGVYDDATIKMWLMTFIRRFFNQQFKRSCMPDGPSVCGLSLSPRGGWHMPSDASSAMWIKECERL